MDAKAEQIKRRGWPEHKMLKALELARDPNNETPISAIAKDNGIPPSTLNDYLTLGRTEVPRMGAPPIVSPAAKDALVAYAGDRCLAASPLSRPLLAEKLRLIVKDLKVKRGGKQREFGTLTGEPGKNWWATLFREYPELRLRVPSRHSAATLRASNNPDTYIKFFDAVRNPLSPIPKPRWFTADEFALSQNKNNSKVLYVEGTGRCEAMESDGYTAHVTLMNLVCGDGEPLETALLFGLRNEDLKIERLTDKVISLGFTSESAPGSVAAAIVWCCAQSRAGRMHARSSSGCSGSGTESSLRRTTQLC